MNSYSQAGQDRFAWEANGFRKHGVFLDVGCNDPFVHNNTAMLEKIGWTGLCVDIAPFDYSSRMSEFLQADASKPLPQIAKFMKEWEGMINYLSLDVDDATMDALNSILPTGRFRCITIEHDVYRVGPKLQDEIYHLLDLSGYERFRKDVKAPESPGMPWSGQPFEDWYLIA